MASVFRVPRDDDPCLNSASVESILPLIPDRGGAGGASGSAAGSSGTEAAAAAAAVPVSGRGSGGAGSQGTQVEIFEIRFPQVNIFGACDQRRMVCFFLHKNDSRK